MSYPTCKAFGWKVKRLHRVEAVWKRGLWGGWRRPVGGVAAPLKLGERARWRYVCMALISVAVPSSRMSRFML